MSGYSRRTSRYTSRKSRRDNGKIEGGQRRQKVERGKVVGRSS